MKIILKLCFLFRGVERLTDLSTEETYDLFNLVKQTEKMLMKKYNTNSCTISIQGSNVNIIMFLYYFLFFERCCEGFQ